MFGRTPIVLVGLLAACGGKTGAAPDAAVAVDAAPVVASCADRGLAAFPWSNGTSGSARGDLAADATFTLVDGTSWSLESGWSGCDSVIVVPDTITVSPLDATSIWEHDLDALLAAPAKNVHYVFVGSGGNPAGATAMQARVDAALAAMNSDDAAWWRARLHVATLSPAGWVASVLNGHGRTGFAIDRTQRIRDLGTLADVTRFDQALSDAGQWPWKNNLAYLANEAASFDVQAETRARLDGDGAMVIPMWSGEVLAESAAMDVTLPDAATMAGFDTLEVEATLDCPDPTAPESTSCGAWDYLATLTVDTAGGPVELARAITPYHRGAHWVLDASAGLPWLQGGGSHHFTWSFAPSWNTQPTLTTMSLRLSNRGGPVPVAATPLFTGGDFNSTYNTTRTPVTVPIPVDAVKVELVALVTGHGAATNQCGEFCNHQHVFTVNGHDHELQFPQAGTEDQCMPTIAGGTTPNQGGTWWYGRGGWCPGGVVTPYVVDVTSEVTPGSDATVSYQGLYANATPPDDSGNIVLSSWIVVRK